jgi:hypothetical protein
MRRIVAFLAVLFPAVAPIPALAATRPAITHTTTVCGSRSMTLHVPDNSYYTVYNASESINTTCVRSSPGHAAFTVTRTDQHDYWGYPNISSGWEWNHYSCSGAGGACFRYPVQEMHAGMPETSIGVAMHGYGIADYDIWFNKTDAHPGQNNGAEIMIWLRHPGVGEHSFARDVVIEGVRFTVLAWRAEAHGVEWNYVAYVCQNQRSILRNFWLNDIFRDAIHHHELSPYWYLTQIDAGFELTGGGAGSQLSMSLRGVR